MRKSKQAKQKERKHERKPKLKEIRLTPYIEEHDYATKKKQTEKILKSGNAVFLVVRMRDKDSARAKELLESMLEDVSSLGRRKTNIQSSGKQITVQIDPLSRYIN